MMMICFVLSGLISIAAAFMARRKLLELQETIDKIEREVVSVSHDVNRALSCDEWRELHASSIETYNAHLDRVTNELTKKLEERDKAIAQQFSEVYEYIKQCNNEKSFANDIMANLESPVATLNKRKPKKDK